LAYHIRGWIVDPLERLAKEVQDILETDVRNYKSYHLLPGQARVEYVTEQIENPYLHLTLEEMQLLAHSALRFTSLNKGWIHKMSLEDSKVLLQQSLLDPNIVVRRNAFTMLGEDEAIEVFQSTLKDGVEEQRLVALTALKWCNQDKAWELISSERDDKSEVIKSTAWNLLTEINRTKANRLRRQDLLPLFITGSGLSGLLLTFLLFPNPEMGTLAFLTAGWSLLCGTGLVVSKLPGVIQIGGLFLVVFYLW